MRWFRVGRIGLPVVTLFCLACVWGIASAQVPAPNPANQAILRWLKLVAADGADPAWEQASFRFQYRITQPEWSTWVANNRARVGEGAAGRRVLEFTLGHDEAPLPPLEWARATYVRTRAGGGRIFERVVAINEGGTWRVADLSVWPDGQAIVTSVGVDPVPYHLGYNGAFLRDPEWRFHRRSYRPRPGPGPPPPTAIVNPRTARPKPPPGR